MNFDWEQLNASRLNASRLNANRLNANRLNSVIVRAPFIFLRASLVTDGRNPANMYSFYINHARSLQRHLRGLET